MRKGRQIDPNSCTECVPHGDEANIACGFRALKLPRNAENYGYLLATVSRKTSKVDQQIFARQVPN